MDLATHILTLQQPYNTVARSIARQPLHLFSSNKVENVATVHSYPEHQTLQGFSQPFPSYGPCNTFLDLATTLQRRCKVNNSATVAPMPLKQHGERSQDVWLPRTPDVARFFPAVPELRPPLQGVARFLVVSSA